MQGHGIMPRLCLYVGILCDTPGEVLRASGTCPAPTGAECKPSSGNADRRPIAISTGKKETEYMREKLTKSDVEKIQAEIDHRKLVERKELIEAVKEARSHGDLSENFEYHAAKKEKNRNESRIRYLERMLKTAIIVEDHSKADEVGLNNTVEIYCEDDDEVETYRIVTSVRGSSLNGLVSIESPIGKALLGHKEGDRVYVKVNDDYGYYVVIRKVIKTESEDGDQIRSY